MKKNNYRVTIESLKDKSFGKIKILSEVEAVISERGNKRRRVLAQCDCGVVKTFNLVDLRCGHTKSCGCTSKQHMIIRRRKEIELKGLVKARYRLFQSYTRLAKKRKYEFLLTYEEFEKLTTSCCIYCGIKPTSIYYNRNKTETCLYNGVDRVDNAIGYIINNCVSACIDCNWSKKQRSFEEFKNWIKKVYLNLYS